MAEAEAGVGNEGPGPVAGVPDLDQAQITVDGTSWTVGVLGRAGSAATGRTPLLLLGFDAAVDGEPRSLEALVVARTLEGLSEEALVAALGQARPLRATPPREAPRGRTGRGRG
jgi:hypothetical protein